MRTTPGLGALLAAALLAVSCSAGTAPVPGKSASAALSCSGCHGSDGNAAPPGSTSGAVATTDLGVGAHQAHVNPGPFRKAVACAECHPVPGTVRDPPHGDGTVDVVFGLTAAAGGARASWDRTTATCTSTYCHGATLSGGTRTAPRWTHVVQNPDDPASEVHCGSCHGVPPGTASNHPAVDSLVAGYTAPPDPAIPSTLAVCATCHPGTVGADGGLDLAGGQHIDGVLQVGDLGCAGCHGDAGDASRAPALRPAPPGGLSGETATSQRAVGAHMAHLLGTTLRSAPLGCSECHAVPTSLLNHPDPATSAANPVIDLTWGRLAHASGATPAWDRQTFTCSATYCHGSTLAGGTRTTPRWTEGSGATADCSACHGVPPPTPAHQQDPASNPVPTDCNHCHAGYSASSVAAASHINGLLNVRDPSAPQAPQTCTGCHGDSGRSPSALQAAPPRAVNGSTSTDAPGVGAHLAHLTGRHLSASPVACTECHRTERRTDHAAGGSTAAPLQWGPLATAGKSYPSFDRTSLSCSATYCHGSTLRGGTLTDPVWTRVTGDPSSPASQVACGSCHGIPPPAPHAASADCGTCHTGYTSLTVNLAIHLDGAIDATGGSCTACHGDASRTPAAIAPAPPAEAASPTSGGAPWAGDGSTGAHLKHLLAGPLGPATACGECHAIPTGPPQQGADTHGDGQATLQYGTLARTDGAAPAWNPATLTCSATYCHGATLRGGTLTNPVWNKVDGTQTACGTCHGVPPKEPLHDGLTAGTRCAACHEGYGGAVGGAATAFTVNALIHGNGAIEATGGTCTSCHGTAGRTVPASADALTASAPPASASGFSVPGAHVAHLTGTTLAAKPVACAECHAVPATGGVSGPHRNGVADVAFGSRSHTGGAVPAWNATALTCATYCHGATLAGGTHTAPAWNGSKTNVACGTCHGVPPPTPDHAGLSAAAGCDACHSGYTATAVNLTLHLDGTVQATGGSCTSCHGTAGRTVPPGADALTPSAPPANAAGFTVSGAHLVHLTGTALAAKPIACAECHTVPADGAASGRHRNGAADVAFGSLSRSGSATPAWNAGSLTCATYCHGATLAGGTRTAPTWTGTSSDVACGTCHGIPPPTSDHAGLSASAPCSNCHAGYAATALNRALHLNGVVDSTAATCTSCHGTAGRTLVSGADPLTPAAPPADAVGFSVPGAHLAHLNHGTGAISRPIACAQCHAVPATNAASGTHRNGAANVVFGTLAASDGASPGWSASALTCSSTYCHGGTLSGGTNTSPNWNRLDGTQAACGTCHGIPPPDTTHAGLTAAGGCADCHTGYTATVVNATLHVNGVPDATAGSCTSCHGTAGRTLVSGADPQTASAPPRDAAGFNGTGAHLSHLNHGSGAISRPIACSQCHTVPASGSANGAHRNGTADVSFGTLARSGGASPSWSASSLTCSATYCHGGKLAGGSNTSPSWNRVDGTQTACGTCHGVPPPDSTHAGLSASGGCSGCHTGYTATTVNVSLHVNGAVDATGGTCTSCHGTEGRKLLTGADPQTASAPPRDAAGLSGTGAHQAHLNKGSGAIGKRVACSECHAVPASGSVSGAHRDGKASVVFGNLSRANGASPAWTQGSLTCAATYCHGSVGLTGGTRASVRWDGPGLSCTACHGMPPNDNCHAPRFRHEEGTACNSCHRNTNASGTTINDITKHIDGVVQGKCSDCHRNESRKC